MTWQEELRQLDSALAGGELSANEYRKRRDEILAAASSAQPPSPVLGAPSASAEGATGGDHAEVTQVVNVAEVEADQTQIIDSATAGGEQNNGDGSSAERTQVTTAPPPGPAQPVPAQPAAPAQQAPQQPVWSAQLPDPNTPTGAFPQQPVPGFPGPAVTPHDAQDLFTSNKAPRGAKKPWLIGIVVLVVLALAGGAVWFFGFRDDNGTQTTADPTNTTSEAPAPPPVDIPKIELPGKAAEHTGEMDIARAGELGVISPAEAALIADAGAESLVYSGAAEGNYRYLLYAYQSDDRKAAEELTGRLLDIQKQLGYKNTEVGDVPGAVKMSEAINDKAAAMRGVYTYGDTTIQLSVLQIPVGSIDELRVQFQRTMTTVTDAAPPAE